MLHDIGLLVEATQLPDRFAEAIASAAESGRPLHQVEQELFGASHAEIGAYLLGVWGLPYPTLEAVAYHHRPSELTQETISEVTAVHVASALVGARIAGPEQKGSPCSQIDLSYLERLGVSDRLEKWELLADEIFAGAEEEAPA
jgi:HD-like signal output (HDOD) protein